MEKATAGGIWCSKVPPTGSNTPATIFPSLQSKRLLQLHVLIFNKCHKDKVDTNDNVSKTKILVAGRDFHKGGHTSFLEQLYQSADILTNLVQATVLSNFFAHNQSGVGCVSVRLNGMHSISLGLVFLVRAHLNLDLVM